MAYREVTMIEVKEVIRQWLSGEGRKAIAVRVGIDRNTVRHYIRVAKKCGVRREEGKEALTEERLSRILTALRVAFERPHGESWAKCEEHREFIEEKIGNGVRLTKVCKLLERQGVNIPYPTLYRFAVEQLGFGRGRTTILVADCEPGQELQLDTGWMGYLQFDERSKRHRFRAWIFTSVCTRHRFVYPGFRETTLDAIEACEAAWEFFGGVFRVLIPDNTKAIVQRADALAPLINPAFLEYAQARGFFIDPTRARHARDKARVERAVQSTRDDCFAGENFKWLEQVRRHSRLWCLQEYGMRRHTTTQRMPLEHFEAEEKGRLLPAPSEPYEVPLWCEPKVHRDQHAQVARALYSLPRRLVGRILSARADRTTVRFYDAGVLVKVHPRQLSGGRSTDSGDFPPEKAAYAMRDIEFLKWQAAKHGEHVGCFAQALLDGPLPWTRMRRVYALLGLGRRYGSERLEKACARALDADMLDVHRLKRMLELGPPPSQLSAASQPPRVIPIGRYMRPAKQYALPFATREEEKKQERS